MSEEKIAEDSITVTSLSSNRPSLSEADIAVLSEGHSHCLICYNDLTVRGKVPCSHDDICGICHLRLRFLHDDKKCPICKSNNDTVIVDRDNEGKQFHDYPRWGDEIGSGFIYRHDVGMFIEDTYYQTEIVPLFAYSCNKCDFQIDETTQNTNKKNTPLRLLEDHLRNEHRLAMCRLCIDHKRDFIARLPRMTPNQLQNHLRKGDGPLSGFNGHPVCEFCRPTRFYDLNYLHQHLHKEHYKCHICEKQGSDDQWFKNYRSLERHFDKQHFLCHDVQCLSARFVAFENELDLRAHELSAHGGTSTGSTKINLEFRTRRVGYDGSGMEDQQSPPNEADFNYDLDGQAFVPESLPNQGGNGTSTSNRAIIGNSNVPLHPLHVQRTEELRAHAAAVRQQQALVSQEESFPTLQSASTKSSSSAPLVGWATGTALKKVNKNNASVGRVTTEAFPALPSSSSAAADAKKKAMKGNVGAARRQFAAMSTSASHPSHQPSWGSNNNSTIAAASSMPASRSTHTTSIMSAPSSNRQSDLSANNFPALGPATGSRPAPYAAAKALSKKNLQRGSGGPTASHLNSNMSDFPATNRKPLPGQQPPSLNSSSDFPPPPSTNQSTQSSVRHQILDNSKVPSQQVMDNVLKADKLTSSAKATVEDMKASLGPTKYKELKRLTKEFASTQLSPEGYVDQSAALFDRGYSDPDFWSFLPSLVESCPNEDAAQHALKYMSSLRQQQFLTEPRPNRTTLSATTNNAPSSKWGGANFKIMKTPNPIPAATTAQRLTQPATAAFPNMIASKKKNAWGGNGTATVVRAKAPPGSVSVAAANEGPQGGTATKFMAKEQKKQAHEEEAKSSNASTNGKKKKKGKNELKALAFGR